MWSSRVITAFVLSWFISLARGQITSQKPQVCGGRYNSATFSLLGSRDGGCDYVVEAASPSVCRLELDLGPRQLPPCPSNLLTLDGRPVCGGGHSRVVQLPFQQPRSTISIRSNLSERDVFNMTVRQIECRSQLTSNWCGGEFSGEHVVILSPGYPSGYPGGVDCKYTITASTPSVCQVVVRFEDSALESSTNCSKDRLQIDSDILCGELRGVRTYYIGDKLDLRFTSDSEGEGRGFKLIARQVMCADDTDPVVIEAPAENEKLDNIVDCFPKIPPDTLRPTLDEGYPVHQRPWPQFNLPGRIQQRFPSRENLPPDNSFVNRIPLEQDSPHDPSFRQYPPISSSDGIPRRVPGSPQSTSRPPQNVLPWSFLQPQSNIRIPGLERPSLNVPYRPNYIDQQYIPITTIRPSGYYDQQYQQCCDLSYSDSHFLIVSPGFPRSRSSDCIYTINRFSSLTNQLRLQFRYFWAGVDTGTGCSGGYLEIDGSRVCGCKTGLLWTSPFLDSETTKTLRLRLDSFIDRLFDGFVIEVFQDDSYSQRYKRLSDATSGTNQNFGRAYNFSQHIETVVERKPAILRSDNYQILLNRPSENLIWDSSRQTWVLPTDLLCLRWNLQDWYLLAREALWALYHCPVSASASGSSAVTAGVDAVRGDDVTQSTACQTCRYFCRQNCRCC